MAGVVGEDDPLGAGVDAVVLELLVLPDLGQGEEDHGGQPVPGGLVALETLEGQVVVQLGVVVVAGVEPLGAKMASLRSGPVGLRVRGDGRSSSRSREMGIGLGVYFTLGGGGSSEVT